MSHFLSTYGKYTIFREILKMSLCLDFGGEIHTQHSNCSGALEKKNTIVRGNQR